MTFNESNKIEKMILDTAIRFGSGTDSSVVHEGLSRSAQ